MLQQEGKLDKVKKLIQIKNDIINQRNMSSKRREEMIKFLIEQ
jgi:hypothetical protein